MVLVFLGTPRFAVPSLERLIAAGHEIKLVITQPDRPKGRKQELFASPVKEAALRHGIEVYQPERIRRPEALDRLRQIAAEAMVVVGYGQIIPQAIIDMAPLGIVNVHGSLLPELRGAAPLQWSIARGYAQTGVTTMRINAGLDTGDMLLKYETAIQPDETAPELAERLAEAGADLLIRTMEKLQSGNISPVPQNDAEATYAPILKKEDGAINWTCPAQSIHNLIRGLQPWPGAYTSFRGQSLHLWRSRMTGRQYNAEPGTILAGAIFPGTNYPDPGVFAVGGDGAALELLEVQLEGRKKMMADVFANGHRITHADRLGA